MYWSVAVRRRDPALRALRYPRTLSVAASWNLFQPSTLVVPGAKLRYGRLAWLRKRKRSSGEKEQSAGGGSIAAGIVQTVVLCRSTGTGSRRMLMIAARRLVLPVAAKPLQ